MGFVWNVVLSFDNEELSEDEDGEGDDWDDGEDDDWDDDKENVSETCEPLEKINAWLAPNRLVSLTGPTYEDGVGNGLDANLCGGGFKHFDIDGFIAVVKAQNWKARSKVQLWVKGAEEGMGTERFTLIELGGSRSEVAAKAEATRKQRAASEKAAKTKKQLPAGRKAATTRKAKQAKPGPDSAT
jgi:hypothetical protein